MSTQTDELVEKTTETDEPETDIQSLVDEGFKKLEEAEETTNESETGKDTQVDDEQDSVDETDDGDTGPEFDSELLAAAETYGISKEEIKSFQSTEELQRAVAMFDRRFYTMGEQSSDTPTPDEELEEAEREAFDPSKQFTFDDPDEFDSQLLAMNEHHGKQLDGMLREISELREFKQQLEQQQVQMAYDQDIKSFDNAVDQMGNEELFGDDRANLTTTQYANREKLWLSTAQMRMGMYASGIMADLDKSLIGRVANFAFSEELTKQRQTEHTAKLTKQSKQRLGGGGKRKRASVWTGPEEEDPYYAELYTKIQGGS